MSFSHQIQRAIRLEVDTPEVLNACIAVVKKGAIVLA
jgi:hypothetical protein